MIWNFYPLECYLRQVESGLSDEFIYRSPLELPQLMNLILKRELPTPRIHDLSVELPKRKSQLASLFTTEQVSDQLSREYPGVVSRLDSLMGLEPEIWKVQIKEASERYFSMTSISRVKRFVESLKYSEIREEVSRQVLNNFSIRKYKLRGTLEWRLEDLFDLLGVTEKCRQIVLVKPLENKVMHKLSNLFGDRVSAVHSKTSLVQMASRERKLNNYIGMTISKYDRSRDVAVVMIEEIPSRQKSKQPLLQITIEIPGERRLGDTETDGAYGTTVLKYFHDCVSKKDRERERELRSRLEAVRYTVFDTQIFTSAYDLEAVKHTLLEMSMHPDFKPIFFSQNRNKVDDQRFVLRDFPPSEDVAGSRKAIVDIQGKGVVFQTFSGDLFDLYDLATLMIAYGIRRGGINLLGIPGMEKTLRPVRGPVDGDGVLRMDIVEKTGDGEYILREAIFFDSHFSDVCNKPMEKDILRGGELTEDYGFFPPKDLIDRLELEGRYSFPYYESQKIKVKLNYQTDKKNYVLGKRKIPKSVRDSMAAGGNYAFIFDFFPCRREGLGLTMDMWEKEETISTETQKTDHILDENKDEILPGRFGRVQRNFFNSLRDPRDTGEILRTGVAESPVSFIEAAKFGARKDSYRDFKEWVADPATMPKLLSILPQFPDMVESEIMDQITGMLTTFADSRYLVRLVEEYVGMNIVVMTYNDKEGLEYALYETPHGVYAPNIFEHLRRNLDRETLILLRRSYLYLPDQYDILVKRPDVRSFSTERVVNFLKTKISLVDVDVYPSKTSENVSLVDLSRSEPFEVVGVRGVRQVIDSLGARSATIFEDREFAYPCFHLNPSTPSPDIPLINLYEFLLVPRPSLYDILKDGSPWKKFPLVSVGVTNLYKEEYITSLYFYVGSHPLCMLVEMTLRDEPMKKLFDGKPLMETPDPYIANQLKQTGFRFNDLILRRSFGKILGGLLLQSLFVELAERSRREGIRPSDPAYIQWRDGLVTFAENSEVKTIETESLEDFYQMIQDVKSLRGLLPPNPLQNLRSRGAVGKFFSESGSIVCPSQRMYVKLVSQLRLMERVITTIPELQGLGGVPFGVYRIQGLYDTTAILSESPNSVLGMETDMRNPNQYLLWQTRCQTSLDRVTLYDSILPEFFNSTFELSPLIGFYGSRNTGLWSVRPPATPPNPEMGVIKVSTKMGPGRNDISRFNYLGPEEVLQIGAQEDTEDKAVLVMEKLV